MLSSKSQYMFNLTMMLSYTSVFLSCDIYIVYNFILIHTFNPLANASMHCIAAKNITSYGFW